MIAKSSRLVVASHNTGKVREIAELLKGFGVSVVGAGELGLPEPDETGATFAENARLKAEASCLASHLPALSDDSGLCVDALRGQPGIYSARWAGEQKDFRLAMKRVEQELKSAGAENRRAHFVCALALAQPDAKTEIFEGRVDGTLAFPPRGNKGFGYDPIFVAAGEQRTFGEMESQEKHAISHRARAFAKLAASGVLPKRWASPSAYTCIGLTARRNALIAISIRMSEAKSRKRAGPRRFRASSAPWPNCRVRGQESKACFSAAARRR